MLRSFALGKSLREAQARDVACNVQRLEKTEAGSAAAAAPRLCGVVWIQCRSDDFNARLGTRTKLRNVGLAHLNHSGGFQPLDDQRILGWHEVRVDR